MQEAKKIIIVYVRVSTFMQHEECQLRELTEFVKKGGFPKDKVEVIQDVISGLKSSRPGLDKAIEMIKAGRVEKFVLWRLDRLGRSIRHLIDMLEFFNKHNVEFVSIKENIDTTTSTGKLMYNILASFASFEHDLIIERTKAGLLRAKASGKVLGRPRR